MVVHARHVHLHSHLYLEVGMRLPVDAPQTLILLSLQFQTYNGNVGLVKIKHVVLLWVFHLAQPTVFVVWLIMLLMQWVRH